MSDLNLFSFKDNIKYKNKLIGRILTNATEYKIKKIIKSIDYKSNENIYYKLKDKLVENSFVMLEINENNFKNKDDIEYLYLNKINFVLEGY